MARTKTVERQYIDRIIGIKQQIDELNREKREIAEKLGMGCHRSRNFPGMLVRIYNNSGGWRVSWKGVAEDLAKKFNVKDLKPWTFGHRKRTYSTPCCSVAKDKSNPANPLTKKAV